MMSEKRCGDCEYFVAFRNYNYETCTNDTITEYCELLQNKETYDRDKGDEIWNTVFDNCPLKTGYVSTESAILLVKSKKEVRKQFDNYVGISCGTNEKLQDENEQLKEENKKLKKRLKKCANNWKQEIVERGKLEEEIMTMRDYYESQTVTRED